MSLCLLSSLLWCMLGGRMCWRCPTTVLFLFWGFVSFLSLVATSKLTACRSRSSEQAGNYLHEYFLVHPFSGGRSLLPNEVSQLTYWGHDEGCTLTLERVTHFRGTLWSKGKKLFSSSQGAVLYLMKNTSLIFIPLWRTQLEDHLNVWYCWQFQKRFKLFITWQKPLVVVQILTLVDAACLLQNIFGSI